MSEYDLNAQIRRRDGSFINMILPSWHDERSVFLNDGSPGLLPNIWIRHPEHPSLKFNNRTHCFEPCDESQVPPLPPSPIPIPIAKKNAFQKIKDLFKRRHISVNKDILRTRQTLDKLGWAITELWSNSAIGFVWKRILEKLSTRAWLGSS